MIARTEAGRRVIAATRGFNVAALVAITLALAASPVLCPAHAQSAKDAVTIRQFQPVLPLSRAGRAAHVAAVVANTGDAPARATLRLRTPAEVEIVGPVASVSEELGDFSERTFTWELVGRSAGAHRLTLELAREDGSRASAVLDMLFLDALAPSAPPYIPEPKPVATSMLIGAHHCPLWEADKPGMWANVRTHPERTPALGFYAQENPEVSDWETKWAVEHGISFFIYCWYRNGQGGPVKTNFGSAIHDALFKSRYGEVMKFTIMWENQSRGQAGVADEKDLMQNLLPYWIENYFTRGNYLKVDKKPVLFIYRPEFLVDDLKGEENVRRAFDLMRKACREAGFDGLYLLGEYRGLDRNHLARMKRLGLDYTFAYCWHVPGSPGPEQAIDAQMGYIRTTQELGVLPQVITVSQAWSGWADEGSIWKIPPGSFERLLERARDFAATLPKGELGSRMLLLDNWNEWGEGHYIAPYREFGFGYLDAVRKVFADAPAAHTDLLPEDIGRGPYDKAYREHMAREARIKSMAPKKVLKAGAPAPGLVAWWAFDEEADAPAALDWSGGRLGGTLFDARRVDGYDGKALECKGGCVLIGPDARLNPVASMSLECRVFVTERGQGNNWFVNKVRAGGTSSGYRMGLLDDKPCFELPLTDWSHHLTAPDPIPRGRWVHVAGTFDGTTMRIYVDGDEKARMDRPAPIRANDFPLCLGNYVEGHAAYFRGLLDEVRLYSRALPAEEVRSRAK